MQLVVTEPDPILSEKDPLEEAINTALVTVESDLLLSKPNALKDITHM
jgi:hypothetical protein